MGEWHWVGFNIGCMKNAHKIIQKKHWFTFKLSYANIISLPSINAALYFSKNAAFADWEEDFMMQYLLLLKQITAFPKYKYQVQHV